MRELVLTVLDVLGLLLVAAGVAALCWPLVGWVSLGAGGVVVLAGSAFGAWQGGRPPR